MTKNIELRHLRYFVVLAEELHFGRAAQRLHIAQPPLSQQIKQLEEELGVQLFERSKKRVQLTEAGQLFFEKVGQLFLEFEQTIQQVQQVSRGETGRLVVGFTGSAPYTIMPKIIPVYRQHFPAIQLVLKEVTTSPQLEALLLANQIDVAFILNPSPHEELEIETVLQDQLVVVLPQNHPLTEQDSIVLKQLASEPFVMYPRFPPRYFYQKIIDFCQQAGFTPQIVQEANQFQTIISLVASGLGVALVPSTTQKLRIEGSVYRPIKYPQAQVDLAAVWRKGDSSPVLSSFLNIVQKYGKATEATI